MSISVDNYTGSLMDVYNDFASQNSNKASKLEDKLNGDMSGATADELMDVCKEFEAYFTEQVFKAMQKMVPENESSDSTVRMTREYINDALAQKYAENSAEGAGLGLAQTLYEQMKRNYNISE